MMLQLCQLPTQFGAKKLKCICLLAHQAGFTLEGTLRAAITNKGTRRDCWLASLLPSDLSLPSPTPYLPPHLLKAARPF